MPIVSGTTFKNTIDSLNLPTTVTAGVVSGVGAQLDQLASAYPDYAQAIALLKEQLSSTIEANLGSAMNGLASQWDSRISSSTWASTPDFYGDITGTVSSVLTSIFGSDAIAPYLGMFGMTAEGVASQVTSGVSQSLTALQNYSNVAFSEMYNENSTTIATNQAADIFADLTWHITKQLSFTAGLRGTYEHLRSGYSSTSGTLPLLGSAMVYQSSGGKLYWESGDYCSWVGRAALNYMIACNNIYASVSRGRRPAVIAFDNRPDQVTKLKPEIIVSYEAGVKGIVLDNKLSYDFSAFYYDWSHFQSSSLATSETGTKIYVADDAGKAHTLGAEVDFRYVVCPAVTVFGNYAYIDGKFNDEDGQGNPQEYAGNRFRLTPKHSAAVGLDVTAPVGKKTMLYFRPSYVYKSKVYFENDNTELLSQEGYGLVNASIGVTVKNPKCYYDVSLFGKNVFDKEYLIDAGNSGNQIGFPTFIAGAPSVYGVSFTFGF